VTENSFIDNINIEEMKNNKSSLTEEDKKYLEIIDSPFEGSFVQYLESGEFYVSNEFMKMLGLEHLSPEEAYAFFKESIHPDDRGRFIKAASEAYNKKESRVRVECRLKGKDPEYMWILGHCKIIYDEAGKPIKVFGIIIDITEQKRNEEIALKAQEKYHKLFTSIDQGFCIVDVIFDTEGKPVDYRFIETNPALKEQTGLDNIEGKLVSEVVKHVNKEFLDSACKAVLTGKPMNVTSRSKALDRWYDICMYKVGEENSKTVAFLYKDVSEEVREKKEMEKTIRMQEEVFANVSHELKTPLNVIFSTNQLMEMYLKKKSFEEIREKLIKSTNIIRQNCYRFTKLINNIVDNSKAESGFLKLNLSNVNIVQVTEDIVQSVSDYVKRKGLSIVFDTNTEEKVIACDPDKIERIILNLISNAIKFTNPGGGIFIDLNDRGGSVEISVRDTGIGMEQAQSEKIFKRFHQVDKSLSRNAEGTGIGLSLARSLVKLHGGKISVESEVGKGSAFKMELPSIIKGNQESPHYRMNLMNDKVEKINIEFSDIYST